MLSANWTEGQPEELARQFLGAVGRQKSDLGTKNFVEFVKVRSLECVLLMPCKSVGLGACAVLV